MTAFVFANNVSTTLAASITSSATTISLASSAGLPTLATGQVMPLTLNDAATGLVYEIVYVTAISGSNVTVERAQEGTGAQAWNTGDYIRCSPTAGTVAALNGSSSEAFNVANATTATEAVALSQVAQTAPQISRTTTVNTSNTTTNTKITFTAPSAGYVVAVAYVNLAASPSNAVAYTCSLNINGNTAQSDINPNNQAEFNIYSATSGQSITVTGSVIIGGTTLNGNSNLQLLTFFVPTP